MLNFIYRNQNNYSSQISSYVRRGKHRPISFLQIGNKVHDFELKSQQKHSDFDLTHRHFFNQPQNTNFHQLQCSQQTNTLSMIFKLSKLNHTSINYALQKMINGGSKKYPIRNLIQAAKQKSFNNVLYTSTINEDYMMFNFSTPILKDYKNLLNIYYDMLFNPLLREEDFKELVWRYNFDQRSRKLEMRGQLAQILKQNDYYEENFVYRQIVKNFYNHKYTTVGDQHMLSKLNYSELVQFYRDTISLNNLTLINHGDLSADQVLSSWKQVCQSNSQLNKQKQQNYKNTISLSSSSYKQTPQYSQKQITLPKTIQFQHMKPQTILLLSYNVQSANQQQKVLLSILSYILFDMPQSPFMRFNTPQTPYPLLYGYKNRYFNIGISFNDLSTEVGEQKLSEIQKQKIMKQKQLQIIQTLRTSTSKKIDNTLIEKCLAHLQANYYTSNGLSIIESIIDRILTNQQQSLKPVLNVTALIERLFKKYRKQDIFQKLITKFLLDNNQYICFRGYNNYEMIENKEYQRRRIFGQTQKRMTNNEIKQILSYQPPNILQDLKVLPQINPIELQFFEDIQPQISKIDGVKVYFQNRLNGVKITLKSDISDLSQQAFPFLQLYCKCFDKLGIKSMKSDAYEQILNRYINKIQLRYQTQKSLQDSNQMKLYLFMTIDFNDRYFQYGFSLINGLIKSFNYDNIFRLSKAIQKTASDCYYQISEDIVSFNGKHLAASKSPFAFFQSPIFNCRSITGMAGDLRKVTNPKEILYGISFQLKTIWQTMFQKPRIEIMLQCKQSKKDFYKKYLQMSIKQIPNSDSQNQLISGVSIQNFPQQKWLKYFPNFQQQLVFECFKFPYYEKKSAAALIFSSLVNKNILQYNKVGGSFLFKGTLITYVEGGRKKVLQLQEYYRKIQQIDQAKRSIFKRFGRYTAADYFQSGISIQQARFFKQAIIATQKRQIQQILNEYILQPLKKGQSSILSLGPRLQNYEPLLKKGWEIERPVDDLSLNVQSYTAKQPHLRLQDYTKIC